MRRRIIAAGEPDRARSGSGDVMGRDRRDPIGRLRGRLPSQAGEFRLQIRNAPIAQLERRGHVRGFQSLVDVLRTVCVPGAHAEQDDPRVAPDLLTPAVRMIDQEQVRLRILGQIPKGNVLPVADAAMSPAQFHEYWRSEHARKVRSNPACAKYIRRYVQAPALDAEYAPSDPAYDGTAELWFDSVQDKDAFSSDPDYLAIVAPDERVLADMSQTRFLLCREEQII